MVNLQNIFKSKKIFPLAMIYNKSPDYKKIVLDLIKNYAARGEHMSLKIHFLDSHLDFSPENLGHVSAEHGERFHQQMHAMERQYNGFWDATIMDDYVSTLEDLKDKNEVKFSSKSS